MRQAQAQIDELDLQVAVVTFELNEIAKEYADRSNMSWPVLIDASRELYESYSMHRGSWLQVFGPASWSVYIKLLLRGRTLRLPTGDVHQLGGDVIIDRNGIVRLHHVGSTPADRPAIESLLQMVTPAA